MGRATAVKGDVEKEISLQELERLSGNSVFVLNNAPREIRGEVLLSIPRPNGTGEDIVRVPKTWIPVDLTDQVEKKNLLASSRFRQYISKKILVLLNPSYAEMALKSDAAQQEKERLENMRSAAHNIMRSQPTTAQTDEDDEDDRTPTTRRRKANLKKVEDEVMPVNDPRVVNASDASFELLLKNLAKKSNQTEILNALRSEGALKKKELRKVIATFGHMDKVVKWAERKLEA